MSSGIEAAGDAVTGMVVGRAIEPAHGEGGGAAHGACLNCGAQLHGSHCHVCGQAAHVHRTLSSIGHDILHGVFHFEGKIWRTLPMLVWRPGDLTRRYIHGERAKFVSPLALFLFSVFLMFAVVDGLAGSMHAPHMTPADAVKTVAQLDAVLVKQKGIVDDLKRQMAALPKSDPGRDALDQKIDKAEIAMDAAETARDVADSQTGGKTRTFTDFNSSWPALNTALKKANQNPDLLLYKLQSSAYKYSWALIPLSTPFIWLLFFWRRQYKLYDHAIFVIYSLSFMLLLVAFLSGLGYFSAAESAVAILTVVVPPLHIYRQLRGAYGSSRFGAIVRTMLVMFFGLFVLTLFVVLLVTMGVMG